MHKEFNFHVLQDYEAIRQSGHLPEGINHTHICLLPKVKSPKFIGQYGPINLCNVIFKIISKVIANRLKEIFGGVMDEAQSAFMRRHLITDIVLVVFELFHHMKMRGHLYRPSMSLKLDVVKDYDRVEWPYLEVVMLRLGLSLVSVSLVMNCVKIVSYVILLNGTHVGPFSLTKGTH
ncbi:hypothetical protein GH714_009418 [Hevea brasiliensis]|uniref:Reverse transcriptase domain-containing protein n=1 Tax=Hevea brasiliensis TaxID=3981 RepID=A0A6A6NGB8_HEVBR|nr:hypothetical protein GH714_009418 [Hevea brasiliensis]